MSLMHEMLSGFKISSVSASFKFKDIIAINIIIINHTALAFWNFTVATKLRIISTIPKKMPTIPTIISINKTYVVRKLK